MTLSVSHFCLLKGVDTALRIIQPKYYKDDHLEMVCAIKDATQNGSRFYVAGRHSSFASVLQDLIIEVTHNKKYYSDHSCCSYNYNIKFGMHV